MYCSAASPIPSTGCRATSSAPKTSRASSTSTSSCCSISANLDDERARRSLDADHPEHRRRRVVLQAARTARHRQSRHRVSGVPDGKPEFDRLIDLPGARKRPHGPRPDHRRNLGGTEPSLSVSSARRARARCGGRVRSDFFQEIKASSLHMHGPDLRHAHAQRRLVVPAGRQISRTRRQNLAHPRRALRDVSRSAARPRPSPRPKPSNGPPSSARAAHGTPTNPFTARKFSPRLVAEFLLLNEDFPRSVRFCVEATQQRSAPHFRRRRRSLLQRRRKDSPAGWSPNCNSAPSTKSSITACTFISTNSRSSLNAIGGALFNAYIFQPFNDSEVAMVQQEEQQQQIRSRRGDEAD